MEANKKMWALVYGLLNFQYAQFNKGCTEVFQTALQVQDLQNNKKSVRSVAAACGIPKRTLFEYASGKVENGSKHGPPTTLTVA